MGKGIGLLANNEYIYKIVTDANTLPNNGTLDMSGFKGASGNDAYETWLAAGNTGTIDEFFAVIGGLAINDLRTTFDIEKVGANISNIYTGDDLTETIYNVDGTDKYTGTYNNNQDGTLNYKTITRNSDSAWFTDTFTYDALGAITGIIKTNS